MFEETNGAAYQLWMWFEWFVNHFIGRSWILVLFNQNLLNLNFFKLFSYFIVHLSLCSPYNIYSVWKSKSAFALNHFQDKQIHFCFRFLFAFVRSKIRRKWDSSWYQFRQWLFCTWEQTCSRWGKLQNALLFPIKMLLLFLQKIPLKKLLLWRGAWISVGRANLGFELGMNLEQAFNSKLASGVWNSNFLSSIWAFMCAFRDNESWPQADTASLSSTILKIGTFTKFL